MGNEYFVGTSILKRPEGYTYADYKLWPEGERWELIQGDAWSMSPAPKRRHQTILGSLYAQLDRYFLGKPCRPHIAPVDVFLLLDSEEIESATNVVQPDAFVVCDQSKLREECIVGAPDFVLEILSLSTAMKDQTQKRLLYERSGVLEYWILNPDTYEVIIYNRKNSETFGLPRVADIRTGVSVSLFEALVLSIRPEEVT